MVYFSQGTETSLGTLKQPRDLDLAPPGPLHDGAHSRPWGPALAVPGGAFRVLPDRRPLRQPPNATVTSPVRLV